MASINNSIINAEQVSVVYGEGKLSVQAVKEVDLEIKRGEVVAIEGPSGSGKTSLMLCVGGIMRPSSGKVWVSNIPIHESSDNDLARLRRNKIGFIFQEFYLVPTMSALENVLVPLIPVSRKFPNLKEKAKALLDEVGLGERLRHRPGQLSGGEKQRVAIARALINSPEIVLGDEITGNLDTKTGMKIIDYLLELRERRNLTVILITHDPKVSARCDRVFYMRDGILSEKQ